jgi:hypothetical protein
VLCALCWPLPRARACVCVSAKKRENRALGRHREVFLYTRILSDALTVWTEQRQSMLICLRPATQANRSELLFPTPHSAPPMSEKKSTTSLVRLAFFPWGRFFQPKSAAVFPAISFESRRHIDASRRVRFEVSKRSEVSVPHVDLFCSLHTVFPPFSPP